MADENSSAPQAHGFAEKLKSWLSCSWTYVCAVWFAMVLTMIYVLRSPLKLQESVAAGNVQNNKLLLMLVCRTANVTAAWLDHNAVCSRAQQLSYGLFKGSGLIKTEMKEESGLYVVHGSLLMLTLIEGTDTEPILESFCVH